MELAMTQPAAAPLELGPTATGRADLVPRKLDSDAKPTSPAATVPETSVAPLLETTDLRIAFNGRGRATTVVDGISYQVASGRTLAIVGESGAGKTLSCRALLGLLPPNAVVLGSARLEGRELLGLTEREIQPYRGKCISMVFQDPTRSLNPTMRVGHQIAEAIREHEKTSWHAAREGAIGLLYRLRFAAPQAIYRSYPHELSGGMQQRVMIAIALSGKPRLLIADEATRSLDATTQAEIMALLMELQSQLGMAIIMITHDLGLAAAFADDVLVMKAGRSVEYLSAATLLRDAQMPYTRALLKAVGMPRATEAAGPASAGRHRLVSASDEPRASIPLLTVCDVVQEYRVRGRRNEARTVRAVSGVSFDLHAGEALGLVGETGCGKSTLARTLLVEPPPVSGSVFLDGVDLARLRQRALAEKRRKIQIVFQDAYGSLNPKWTVSAIVEEPLRGFGVGRSERQRRIQEALERVGLPYATYGRRRPRTLSGGQAQRVAIARALAPQPRLIVLDEALSSLDALVGSEILELLRGLREELGVALLMISHDVGQVRQLCDRIAVMHAGRFCEIGATEALLRAPTHPYTAALLASIPSREQRDDRRRAIG